MSEMEGDCRSELEGDIGGEIENYFIPQHYWVTSGLSRK